MKSFQKVIYPQKFTPTIISEEIDFEKVWQTKKPWILSNLSHIAYFKENKITEFMDKLGASKTFFYDNKGAQAFLSIWQDKAILTFRGTQSVENKKKERVKLSFFRRVILKTFLRFPLNPFSLLSMNSDILADLKFFQTPFNKDKKVYVHSGFLEEIDKIWDSSSENNILNDINQYAKNLPIWVTGHSLGGAMATLAGMKYSFEAITTFGEPRVGRNIDSVFQAKKHLRYVNGDDPVTKLPPALFSYYKHHGENKSIADEDGKTNMIYDHSIIYYTSNLR